MSNAIAPHLDSTGTRIDCATNSRNLPLDTTPRCLVRDRDSVYGLRFHSRLEGTGIKQAVIASRSPWQNARLAA